MSIEFINLSQTFSSKTSVEALEGVSFSVKQNEFICIVGPSGCGKTTLLRLIAGLLKPSQGRIKFSHSPEPLRPQTAMVFQHQGLFPWMTVLENVAFGLEMQGIPKAERHTRASEFVSRVGLGDFLHSYPHQLSGGMRQRVAILRAFLSNPQILLMDEPFGALDAQTRILMQQELLNTWLENPKTVVYITHDIEEAILLGDRVLVMSGRPGKIIEDLPISLPRPRNLETRTNVEFEHLHRKIWDSIESEVRRGLRLAL
jgi:NitT/TauT family transport system ATP-binding protein